MTNTQRMINNPKKNDEQHTANSYNACPQEFFKLGTSHNINSNE